MSWAFSGWRFVSQPNIYREKALFFNLHVPTPRTYDRTDEHFGICTHLKSLLVHHEVIVPVTKGALDLGPWQQIFYAEFDGRRRKRMVLKVMGE